MATRVRGNSGGSKPRSSRNSDRSSSRRSDRSSSRSSDRNLSRNSNRSSSRNSSRGTSQSLQRSSGRSTSQNTASRVKTTGTSGINRSYTSQRSGSSQYGKQSRPETERVVRTEKARTGGVKQIFHDAIFGSQVGEIDYSFLTIVIAVLAMGLVILLSASAPKANAMYGNSYYFFIRQLGFAALGLVGMFLLSRIDYKVYKPLIPVIALGGIVLLILVAIPGVGVARNGARRWLFGIQPSEFMKPITAMTVAYMISKLNLHMKKISNLILPAIFLAIVVFLMFLEPHVSGAVIIVGIAGCIMLVAGFPVLPVIILGLGGCVGVVLYAKLFSPTRWARLVNYLNPFADAQGSSYQIAQSIYTIGSGGITGRGLGESLQKFQLLPEPYNDFIFSIVCEELGLIGALFVIVLFSLLIIRGAKIAMNAPDRYSMLLATGIVAQVAIQSIMNMGVASGLIPNTGVSLPFFSYGGTSILTLLCEMGILLNISRQSKKQI